MSRRGTTSRICAAVLAAALSTGGGFGPGAAQAQQCALPQGASTMVNAMAQQLNRYRAGQGLPPVRYSQTLSRAAQAHACDMQQSGSFAHRGSDGGNHRARIERAGYCAGVSAENLAWGYRDSSVVIAGWDGSPGHRQVMRLQRADEFGIGIAQGAQGPFWVLEMAQSC